MSNKKNSKPIFEGLAVYQHPKVVTLESGKKLRNLEIAYHTYGQLNAKKDNVIWACHALTANSDVLDWWKGLFCNNALFNPEEHFIGYESV